jgi:hypothetical protein
MLARWVRRFGDFVESAIAGDVKAGANKENRLSTSLKHFFLKRFVFSKVACEIDRASAKTVRFSPGL